MFSRPVGAFCGKNRRRALLILACVFLTLGGCSKAAEGTPSHPGAGLNVPQTGAYVRARGFLLNKMVGADGGVHTNFLPADSSGDITRGYAVLAESQGLLMRYAVQTGDSSLFEKSWDYVRTRLQMKNGLIAWRCVGGTAADSNATVDDLRICQSLRLAAGKFHRDEYRQAADGLADALYTHCRSGTLLLSGSGPGQPVLTSYLDLAAIDANAAADGRWGPVASRSRALAGEARVSENLPFFRQTFLPAKNAFENQTRYDMVSSLLALFYQSEGGTRREPALGWLEQNCTRGLVSAYTGGGAPASAVRSTAIYALTMLIARGQSDAQLYESAFQKLSAFQVNDAQSPLYGGFGDAASQEAYSFDNLLALLALTPSNG